jgi:hypothetical protein
MSPIETNPPPWRQYLHALPEAEPDPQLWMRLQRARTRRRVGVHRAWAAAAAAVVFIALGLAWLPFGGSGEQGLSPDPAPALMSTAAVQQLDVELNLAYARGADEAEIAALWDARSRLLASEGDAGAVVLARL